MRCPYCNSFDLRATNFLETEYAYGFYYNLVEGTCPDCGKSWRWIEVLTLDHYEDIEEIETNDHL